jgi:hypothetical protein
MPIFISRGRFTSDAIKGMLAKPENREEAVAKLFQSVGGRLVAWRQRPSGAPGARRSWKQTSALVEANRFTCVSSTQSSRTIKDRVCPKVAQSGHVTPVQQCPLLGVKRTSIGLSEMSAYDPKRHWHAML